MSIAFVVLVAIHALIHLMGAAKAFAWAELPQLVEPISPPVGVLWLVAALLFGLTAISYVAWPRWWWAVGAVATALSMAVISQSWTDAKAGALANAIIAAGVVFGFLSQGPLSLRARYDGDVRRHLSSLPAPSPLTDADLVSLPAPIQRLTRFAAAIPAAAANPGGARAILQLMETAAALDAMTKGGIQPA